MKEQLISIAKGAAIAAAGAVLTYLSQAVTGVDFGVMTPAIVAAFSVMVNAGRKALEIVQK